MVHLYLYSRLLGKWIPWGRERNSTFWEGRVSPGCTRTGIANNHLTASVYQMGSGIKMMQEKTYFPSHIMLLILSKRYHQDLSIWSNRAGKWALKSHSLHVSDRMEPGREQPNLLRLLMEFHMTLSSNSNTDRSSCRAVIQGLDVLGSLTENGRVKVARRSKHGTWCLIRGLSWAAFTGARVLLWGGE